MKPSPCVIVDSREQEPWTFSHLPTMTATLTDGDYSLAGLQGMVVVERKSLPDLLSCIGSERARFVRELTRLRAYPYRAVVVEASLADLEAREWRSRLTAAHVLGSVASWQTRYCPFIFAGSHAAAGRWAERFLFQVARHVAETYSAAAALLDAAPESAGATP